MQFQTSTYSTGVYLILSYNMEIFIVMFIYSNISHSSILLIHHSIVKVIYCGNYRILNA